MLEPSDLPDAASSRPAGRSDGGWQAHVLAASRQALHLRLIGQVVMTVVPVAFGREGRSSAPRGPRHTLSLGEPVTAGRGRARVTHLRYDVRENRAEVPATGGRIRCP